MSRYTDSPSPVIDLATRIAMIQSTRDPSGTGMYLIDEKTAESLARAAGKKLARDGDTILLKNARFGVDVPGAQANETGAWAIVHFDGKFELTFIFDDHIVFKNARRPKRRRKGHEASKKR